MYTSFFLVDLFCVYDCCNSIVLLLILLNGFSRAFELGNDVRVAIMLMTYGLNHRQTIRPAILLQPLCLWTYFHEFAWFDWHFELITGVKKMTEWKQKVHFDTRKKKTHFNSKTFQTFLTQIYYDGHYQNQMQWIHQYTHSAHWLYHLNCAHQWRISKLRIFQSIELELIEFKMQIYGADGEWHFE